MTVYPAIDLMAGRAVRLRQGDPFRQTAHADDPVAVARQWASGGARWLHVVDLDGALHGAPRHLDTVGRICHAVPIPVQVGGGVRTMDDLRQVLDAGATRVILGTAALMGDVLRAALAEYGERIAVALDAREGMLAVDGWTQTSRVTVLDAARRLAGDGVQRFIYTDIGRDGMLTGPDVEGLSRLVRCVSVPVILSGGISGVADVRAAGMAGAEGLIIGRALYESRITLAEALDAAGGEA